MMIYFACNNIDVEELIRCSFSISKTEYKNIQRTNKYKRKVFHWATEQAFQKEQDNNSESSQESCSKESRSEKTGQS